MRSSAVGAAYTVYYTIQDFFVGLWNQSKNNVVGFAIGLVLVCMCCIMCLVYYLMRLLDDDDDDPFSQPKQQQQPGRGVVGFGQGGEVPHSMQQPANGGGARQGGGAKPRVRWLPLRRPKLPSSRGGGGGHYMRAGCDEDDASMAPRYAIAGASSEESDGESMPRHEPERVSGETVSVSAVVPPGGEAVFRIIMPSGAQIVVPLPLGTHAGDAVDFELNPAQMAALPASDLEAILDGRFHVEPGDGE